VLVLDIDVPKLLSIALVDCVTKLVACIVELVRTKFVATLAVEVSSVDTVIKVLVVVGVVLGIRAVANDWTTSVLVEELIITVVITLKVVSVVTDDRTSVVIIIGSMLLDIITAVNVGLIHGVFTVSPSLQAQK